MNTFSIITIIYLGIFLFLIAWLVIRLIRLIDEMEKSSNQFRNEVIPRLNSTLDELKMTSQTIREKTQNIQTENVNQILFVADFIHHRIMPIVKSITMGFGFVKNITGIIKSKRCHNQDKV